MVGFVRVPVAHPKLSNMVSSTSSASDTYENRCEDYFKDLYLFMQNNTKICGAKAWWDLDLVTKLCQYQMDVEHTSGLDKKQNGDSLDER
jgi:hypothetical protein